MDHQNTSTTHPTKSHKLTLPLILIANVIPLIGVLFINWNLAQIVILYWIENIIIGLWNIPRILLAKKSPIKSNIILSIFFTIHYSIFCMVHGAFILHLLGKADPSITTELSASLQLITSGVIIGAITMFFSIGWHFIQTHIQTGEYKNWKNSQAMFHPYPHILIIHIAIIITGIITHLLGSPIALLILLITGKTLLEYRTKKTKQLSKKSIN